MSGHRPFPDLLAQMPARARTRASRKADILVAFAFLRRLVDALRPRWN